MNELDNSRPLDIWIYSNRPEIIKCTEILLARISLDKEANMKIAQIKKHLRLILTDLFVVHKENNKKFISYSRDTSGYIQGSRMDKIFIKRKYLIFIIDWLEKEGYIEHFKGFYDRIKDIGRLSRMRASKKLLKMFVRHHGEGGIILRRQPPIELRDSKKREIWFDTENIEIKQMIKNVNKINKVLGQHEIGGGPNNLCSDEVQKDIAACKNQFTQKYVRIFNNSDFGQGGRFYKHWSQMVHRESRKFITIDNNATVECDYSCLHITMLYAIEKLIPPSGDLYFLHEISTSFRKLIKKAVNICINAKNKKEAKQAIQDERLKFEEQTGLKPPTPTKIINAIENKHPEISKYFCSGYGVKLQNMDSNIAQQIMLDFAMDNIVCLSIHDSFIVENKYQDRLINLMKEEFYKVFNLYPQVTIK